LTEILQRLNAGEDPAQVKKEAQALLATLNPAELSFAEQKLLDAGLSPEILRQLCAVHLEMLGDEMAAMKAQLVPGHVLHTMVSEHDVILGYLDALEGVNRVVQQLTQYDATREEFAELVHIAEHLVEAESHHQREEEVLFPELERRGVTGPPGIMRLEHQIMRPRKKELLQLAEGAPQLDFAIFRKKLAGIVSMLVPTLRDHIFKENSILYPTALQVIADETVWERMRQAADKIGYCCFTPAAVSVYTLDLRTLLPFERHDRIFQVWQHLPKGQTLRIINDHDPKPLHYQLMMEYPGQYDWAYEQQGPRDWIVRIQRIQEAVPVGS